jgi:hypothetical protein
MKKAKKYLLSQIGQNQLWAFAIPKYKAMGFPVDSKLISLSAEMKAVIEYHIGDQLKEIKEAVTKIVDEVKKPFIDEFTYKSDDVTPEMKQVLAAEADYNVNQALQKNDEYKKLVADEEELWKTEIETVINPIVIEMKEYDIKFGEPKQMEFEGRVLTIDGYDCLLQLVTKGVIVIDKPEEIAIDSSPEQEAEKLAEGIERQLNSATVKK